MNLITRYVITFLLTLLIEFLVYYIFIRREPFKLLVYSLVITSITLPIATNIYLNFFANFFVVETAVFLLESLLLMWLLEIKYQKAILISAVANFITTLLSLLFFI